MNKKIYWVALSINIALMCASLILGFWIVVAISASQIALNVYAIRNA